MIHRKIIGQIKKDLINGVHMDIFRRNELKVAVIDFGTDFNIAGHAGWCDDIVDGQGGIQR